MFLCLEAVTKQIPSWEAPALQEKTNLYQTSYVHSPLQGGGNNVKPIGTHPNPRSSMLYYVTTCSISFSSKKWHNAIISFPREISLQRLKANMIFSFMCHLHLQPETWISCLSVYPPSCLSDTVYLSIQQVTLTFYI